MTSYPYAIGVLCLLAAAGVALAVCPREQVRWALWSGVLSMPSAATSMMLVPEYWHPRRLLDWGVGLEDIGFTFACGILVWVMAIRRVAPPPVLSFSSIAFLRLFLCCAAGALPYNAARYLGCSKMASAICTMVAITMLLASVSRELRALIPRGSVFFGLYYSLFVASCGTLFPSIRLEWSRDGGIGYFVAGLPIEEMLWGLSMGAAWPAIMVFAFGHCPARRCVTE